MRPRKRHILPAAMLGLLILGGVPSLLNADRSRSNFAIEITLSRKMYAVGESLNGEIVIDNQYPATLPVTFEMKMYHDGELKHQSEVHVKTFLPGELPFSFRTFGIPETPLRPEDIGKWEIIIKKINADEANAVRAEFEVVEEERP